MTAAHGRSGPRRRRTIDGATVSRLFFGLPWFLTSLVVVLAGGARLARVRRGRLLGPCRVPVRPSVLRCRPSTEEERDRFAPVWDEVPRRAGLDGSRYSLWSEPAAGMSAQAGAGQVVAVTD
ncbi:hypothetical protein [Actinomadura sp. 3N508]|uniref:hypothetical protein n=1 Tax=Actinomadura sp. 3N508 TaxID=3375153 RepID=UPI00379048C4